MPSPATDPDLVAAYDYELPEELVADEPAAVRSASRLMVIDAQSAAIQHRRFVDLSEHLRANDLLVFNDARVVPARIAARKATGGAVELFVTDVVEPGGPDRWTASPPHGQLVMRCMTRSSKKLRGGARLTVTDGAEVTVERWEGGIADVSIRTGESATALLERLGEVPLPPYIVRRRQELGGDERDAASRERDRTRYQTVYASTPGAVAAPTAGLHFDEELLRRLDAAGIRRAHVTLYVGPGTFRPVTSERLSAHEMHAEEYAIGAGIGPLIARTRREGGRVVAVGTTTVRTLEAEARRDDPFTPGRRETSIFIRPGFEFRAVDAMITNFHLPRSTLLALVHAFGGAELMRRAYAAAIAERYRFYSYGDAMLIERSS